MSLTLGLLHFSTHKFQVPPRGWAQLRGGALKGNNACKAHEHEHEETRQVTAWVRPADPRLPPGGALCYPAERTGLVGLLEWRTSLRRGVLLLLSPHESPGHELLLDRGAEPRQLGRVDPVASQPVHLRNAGSGTSLGATSRIWPARCRARK